MDGIYDSELTASSNIAGLIRSDNSGMCSGEPRGVSYPGVPTIDEVCKAIGVDPAGKMTENEWIAACEYLDIDD